MKRFFAAALAITVVTATIVSCKPSTPAETPAADTTAVAPVVQDTTAAPADTTATATDTTAHH